MISLILTSFISCHSPLLLPHARQCVVDLNNSNTLCKWLDTKTYHEVPFENINNWICTDPDSWIKIQKYLIDKYKEECNAAYQN